MTTLDEFFGDGSEESIPECSFCGGIEGELVVSIKDAYGPTHWHHAACKGADDAKKGIPLTPTWDEAMDADVKEKSTRLCLEEDSKGNFFSKGFM